MQTYFFDVESFPNFSCITFLNGDTREITQFSFGLKHDDFDSLNEFLKNQLLLIGYNNISYDNPVIRFIQSQKDSKKLAEKIFDLSQKLVSDFYRNDDDIKNLRYPRYNNSSWDFLDLMKIMAFDKLGISLKQIAINLRHNLIQDLPLPYDHFVENQKEVKLILDYNINDVLITEKLYKAILPQIQLRDDISTLYNVNVRNASDSKMGNVILEHYYKEELGADIKQLREMRTVRERVNLAECVPPIIEFKTAELQNLKKEIENTIVVAPNFKFSANINFYGTGYSIGSGGIHSTEEGCEFYETPEIKIITCDVASFYPSSIIINNIYPSHLGEDFVKVMKILTSERVAAKKKNKVKADALKISINGLYGKLNSNTFWLEDAKAMLSVTIGCQLYLLMLIEDLELASIRVISGNTDGIESLVPFEKEKEYFEICKKWEEKTGFVLEYDYFSKYIKRDVNNYVSVTTSGKIKQKGAFIEGVDLKKGYKHPIVPAAVNAYFLKGIYPEQTISKCKDILDFCVSQKSGSDFGMEYHTKDGIENLQKTNRFYISNSGGAIIKRKKTDDSTTGLFVGKLCQILNNYDENKPFEDYDVNLDFYIREARKIIQEVRKPVIVNNLFDCDGDATRETLFVFETPKTENNNDVTSFNWSDTSHPETEQEKLKREILESPKTKKTFDVNARYAIVTKVDFKYSPKLTLYSLKKGTTIIVKLKKEDMPLQIYENDILYCSKFEKCFAWKKTDSGFVQDTSKEEWWLREYKIVNDIDELEISS